MQILLLFVYAEAYNSTVMACTCRIALRFSWTILVTDATKCQDMHAKICQRACIARSFYFERNHFQFHLLYCVWLQASKQKKVYEVADAVKGRQEGLKLVRDNFQESPPAKVKKENCPETTSQG